MPIRDGLPKCRTVQLDSFLEKFFTYGFQEIRLSGLEFKGLKLILCVCALIGRGFASQAKPAEELNFNATRFNQYVKYPCTSRPREDSWVYDRSVIYVENAPMPDDIDSLLCEVVFRKRNFEIPEDLRRLLIADKEQIQAGRAVETIENYGVVIR